MASRIVDTAAALLIGNELLSGKVADQNLFELAKTLRALGIRLCRVVVLPDDVAALAAEIRALSASFDVVFTSGGVGPTHDDVTIEAVARAFDQEVVQHPALVELLERVYREKTTPAHLAMARVPAGAELCGAPDVEWPTTVMKNVWILPGVPDLFRFKLLTVRAWLGGPKPFVTRALYLRTDEPDLKPLLDELVARHPEVEIGSYPKWFEASYRTKVTFDAREQRAADAALEELRARVPSEQIFRSE
ncbi:MAG TPA: molybdopterin-binding protein [Polyangiaceae bacterium]|jgi:molybdenum cofactor synthesis domain-containing protein